MQMTPNLPALAAPPDPLCLIQQALDKGIDPDQLRQLMDLQERWERNRAKERYAQALAAFQAEVPAVFKARTVKGQNVNWTFASLSDVMHVIQPVLTRHAIVPGFGSDHAEDAKHINITVDITVGTHSVPRQFRCPVPTDVKVNDAQRYGIALSYAKRFALCAALNLNLTDRDTDAQGLFTITPAQQTQLEALIVSSGANPARFLEWAQVATLAEMEANQFAEAVAMLKAKQKQGGKA